MAYAFSGSCKIENLYMNKLSANSDKVPIFKNRQSVIVYNTVIYRLELVLRLSYTPAEQFVT